MSAKTTADARTDLNLSDSTRRYLERNGFDTDVDLADLSRAEAKELVIEIAYYRANLSDPTYHGVNHGAKVNAISTAVKHWPQFDTDDFRELDRAAGRVFDFRRYGGDH